VSLALLLLCTLAPLAWGVRILLRERRPDRIPILCYHRFLSRADAAAGRVPDREMGWVCYDDEFARQMEHLATAGYTTLDMDDYLEIREGRRPRPERPILLTMDDGYRSNYEIAFPILKRLAMKATIYVAPEPDADTRRQVTGIDGFPSPAQLRTMAGHGISIQSHTLTHAILTELPDAEVRFELDESRRVLEATLGRPVRHFCFPRGGVDRRVRRLVGEAGYRSAVGASQGTATALDTSLDLPRLVVERDMALDDFRRILSPRHAALTRAMGAIKSVPRRLVGARRTRRLRDLLHRDPLRPIFRASGLRFLVAAGFAFCTVGSLLIAFTFLGR